MKVMNIILDGRIAGPQVRIYEIASALKKKGVETVVVLPKKNSEKFRALLDREKIRWKAVDLNKLSKNLFGIIKWILFFIPQVFSLMKIIKKEKPCVIHCNSSWQWKGVIAGFLAKRKIIWHLNDTRMNFLVRNVCGILIKYADALIVEGKRVRNYYLSQFKCDKKVFIIQAPVDTKRFNPAKVNGSELLNKYNGLKIISVGNVNPNKGFEYLIEAAEILSRKRKNLFFFIAGYLYESQKKYIDYLKGLIEKKSLRNVIFLGGVDNIEEILKSADIYVCSSIAEASPQSVWEAMSMEKPIISTDVGSVSDFLIDGKNGFLIPIRNPGMIAEKIEKYRKAPELMVGFGKEARKTAVKYLDVDVSAENFLNAYKYVCNG